MPTYNKLVRDKIPQIIEQTGKEFHTRTLNEEEYIVELKKKLNEEISEYQNSRNNEEAMEELADVLEVIHSLAKIHGESMEVIEQKRKDKATQKGGFISGIFLEHVED